MTEKIKLNLPSIIALLLFSGSIVSTYFVGLANSKEYTDVKVQQSNEESQRRDVKIFEKVSNMEVMIARIDQILIERFGKPKSDK